jgi:predicted RNase H-like nuclease
MRAVLGIDAAWTLTQPSGVAVVAESSDGWRLAGVVSSYQRFYCLADPGRQAELRPSGSEADAVQSISCASRLCGGAIDLIAVDMPLARTPITGRRISDNAVSRAYGARQCGTHTPNALRPGRVSENLRDGFAAAGYPLLTTHLAPRGLIEVYPHPALVELAAASTRLPYKISRVRSYWPRATPSERRERLLLEWRKILELLEQEITGVRAALPLPATVASGIDLKAFEDALDAVICAWVAISALEDWAKPYGDENSAIWVPSGAMNPRRTTPVLVEPEI